MEEHESHSATGTLVDRVDMLNNLYYLELVIKEELFYQDRYGDQSIQRVARSVSFPVNEFQTVIYFHEVQQYEISLIDTVFSVGQLSESLEETFKIQDKKTLTLPQSLVPVEINISLNLNQVKISRSLYSVLDFLGDIGGLSGAVNAILGGVVLILQFDGLYQFLTPNMYKVN